MKATSLSQDSSPGKGKRSSAQLLRKALSPALGKYALAFFSVLSAALLGRGMEIYWQATPFASLFFCAIILSAWYGGAGPGLFAWALSVLLFDYFFLLPFDSWAVNWNEVPRLVVFAGSSLIVGLLGASQKRANQLLKRAQKELTVKIEELRKSNDALLAENTERKQAEEALRRSEAYLAEAQRLSRTGSFGWNVSTGEIFWSEETMRIFGLDRAAKPTLEFVKQRTHPEDAAFVQDVLQR
ncbi:MAG TPA: DUF4118 domain-containing protein, partial [Candidatus Methylacidiphilales bacterium]